MFSSTRAVAVAVATFAATVLPLLAAAPAHADRYACTQFLEDLGYEIEVDIIIACTLGEKGRQDECEKKLVEQNVRPTYAMEACRWASYGDGL